ncbi:hemerythrin domain-containing protein [Pseudomonadota bacterium]
MNALTIIRREHRDLGMTLLSFESLLKGIEDNRHQPDATFFRAILNYLDSFLNRFHHPKEDDYLFPALLERYPASETLIQVLQKDHLNGDLYCQKLGDALARYESDGTGLSDFHYSALDYIKYERLHIKKEETELLPLAYKHLTESDWEPIDIAFSRNDDPMFGDQRKQQYQRLSKLINNVCIYGDPLL